MGPQQPETASGGAALHAAPTDQPSPTITDPTPDESSTTLTYPNVITKSMPDVNIEANFNPIDNNKYTCDSNMSIESVANINICESIDGSACSSNCISHQESPYHEGTYARIDRIDGLNTPSGSVASLSDPANYILPVDGIVTHHSEENLLRNELNTKKSNEISYVISSDGARRNSLPENKLTSPVSVAKDADSVSMNELQEPTRKSKTDSKNLTGVVKNVHGLFSLVGGSLKNAYKPMEKNLGGIMLATQKNLSAVKYDYLNKSDKQNIKAAQSLNKYSTLNLLNDSGGDEDELFKKCDKFPSDKSINGEVNENGVANIVNFTVSQNNTDCSSLESKASSELIISSDSKEFDSKRVTDETDTVNSNERTEILETAVSELHKELAVLKTALIDKDAIKKNLESRLNLLMKQLESVTIERDASVVRYAVSERHILEATKSKEAALAAEQIARREATTIAQRLRTANAEKTRATGALDMKCHELSLAQRETAKIKEELQSCEVKMKWAQSKLVSEMEGRKESSALVENLSFQIKQMEGGNAATSASTIQSSDIDAQLREKEATVILERHERERVEARCKQIQAEFEQLKVAANKSAEEARELRAQVEAGAAESAAFRRTCSELREQGAKDCERLAVAQARAARCDTLAIHLQQEQERSAKLAQELEAMRTLREEALAEGELKARREAELLRQTERLTAIGVKLQGTCSEAEAKALALTVDNASLREAAAKAAAEVAEARLEVSKEREGRAADARALASRAAQHARGEREALTALEAARGEARVLSTKHASAIKELKRELQQAKRRCDRMEAEGRSLPQSQTQLSSERTGSTSSLSSYEGHGQQIHCVDGADALQDVQQASTPDRQQLVERIVSLQRAAARRGEKLEFLEEHNRQLTQELQRKTRLLRAFLVSAPTGSLTSPASDVAKAEVGRHGGVMASVYGSQVTDETMTLELSLEINAKLQSLLEDTLLSNITLKENMDTLGDEITRLKESQKSSRKK
ncbi:coiled-coil domain-containing protein 186-like isoform X2 [Arctopsyche grandis]|uniref:coiled-coil domain-containing protein 186-like isoform X2 n=1 Tax=Arctopsyche grandis TaxID=121162 RepID=UPI00406D9E4F